MCGLVACSSEANLAEQYRQGLLTTPDGESPLEIWDTKGGKWVRGDAVTPSPEPTLAEQAQQDEERARRPQRPMNTYTLDELTENLRPITFYNGYQYTLDGDRPRQHAKRVLEGKDEQVGRRATESTEVLSEEEVPSEELKPRQVFGTDSRVLRRENTTFPYRANIVLRPGNQGQAACSATLVGASTATSVAHCFHSGSNWYSTRVWAPGYDSQDSNPAPYGQWTGCYWVTIPGGYASSGGDFTYDYAVMEFSNMFPTCNLYPGNTVGALGWQWMGQSQIEGSNVGYVIGYPKDKPSSPQLWSAGNSYIDTEGSDQIDHEVDTSVGQSGSGYYVIQNGSRIVVGSHSGSYFYLPGWQYYNRARRIDGSYYDLIKDYSAQ